MAILNQFSRIDPTTIQIDRENRQRRIVETGDLEDSIRKHGVLSPLLVERRPDGLWLIFGERRLTTALKLGLPLIPVRFANDLDPITRQIIELEENLKRMDLHWRDQVRAIGRVHELYAEQGGEWTQSATAEKVGLTPSHVSRILRVFRDIDSPKIAGAGELTTAFNILTRQDERKIGDALSELVAITGEALETAGTDRPASEAGPAPATTAAGTPPTAAALAPRPAPKPAQLPAESSILNTSFLDWAPQYSGPRFNFLHCDFPYGVGFNTGFGGSGSMTQKRTAEETAANQALTYDDSPSTYWDLCKCLCENLDRVMAHSSHLLFWTSAGIGNLTETLEFFRQNAPSLVFGQTPLIWHKSDNKGILADPKRGPRHIYEVALIAARDDRPLVKATSDLYSAPTDKSHHPSAKPEPMLRYFFQMFVDEGSRVLDPTCGGGSALRAAEALGAAHVLGLELSPLHHAEAKKALQMFRNMRALGG